MHGQSNDPLHGITLEKILAELESHYGWKELSELIPIRCFLVDPSISSSLKFLRKTPWARAKVEELYLSYLSPDPRRASTRAEWSLRPRISMLDKEPTESSDHKQQGTQDRVSRGED